MSTSLSKCRIGSNCNFALTLKDSGVDVDWSTVTIRQIFMYSIAQKAWSGKCTYHLDTDDDTKLKVTYPASQQMYMGDHRIIIQISYGGDECTYDAKAVNIVPLTEDVTGDTTIEAEDIEVGIEVSDLSTSVISEILEACQIATNYCNNAIDAADAKLETMDTKISECSSATQSATNATINANTAKTNANTAASNANTKAALADEKATLANTKANLANEKAEYANTQGNYAKAQGDYAKQQGQEATYSANLATEASISADNAASSANDAATACNTATAAANAATTNANTAATNANNKVTELNGYATRLQAVEGKTSKISHNDNTTFINEALYVSGVSEFDSQATFNDDAIVEGDIIGHGNTNVTGDVTCDNGLVSLTEIATKVNELDYSINTDNYDLGFIDESGYAVAVFNEGEVKTKKFDSSKTPKIDNTNYDFALADENGNIVLAINGGDIVTKNFDSSHINENEYSDSSCINVFVNEMNKYAVDFGMTNTHFDNASGMYTATHLSTAKDIMRLCACCTASEKLMRFWGKETYSVNVGGSHSRTISGTSTYKGDAMESVGNYYHIYGGKSGSWTLSGFQNKNLTLVCKSNVDDAWLVGCIIRSNNSDRGVPFKQLLDWIEAKRVNPNATTPTIEATYACGGVVPPHNPMAYADVDFSLVGKDADTQYLPASMTKLMTSLIVLDNCDLNETLTIKASDIQSGSGDTYYEGDTISIRDAIVAMLLPSSNTLAVALSRFTGKKILNRK